MLHHPAAVRQALAEATDTFLATLRAVRDDQWDQPGALGEWTVRELAAHAVRAFTTVETYLAAEPTVDRPMADAGEYYRTVLADARVHAGVAQRGRDAGAALTDPVGEAEVVAARVLALVVSSDDDEPVNTFAGQIVLSEYLATRTVELGVHTLDLQRATGQPVGLPAAASAVPLAVLVDLADPTRLLLALTGREPLPAGYNVLG
jgi:uncharacterized protein (TIGR03086 family)